MEINNAQTGIPKAPLNQNVSCPWTSTAPLLSSIATKPIHKLSDQQRGAENLVQNPTQCQHAAINQTCCDKHQMIRAPAPLQCPSLQQSSNHFFNFLRLMQLFPDVHPATLHTVLVLCKNDFFCAVDKLLYAKRFKQMYGNGKNAPQACNSNTGKENRFKPYCYARPAEGNVNDCGGDIRNGNPQGHLTLQHFSQVAPIDATIKGIQTSSPNDGVSKVKSNELRKAMQKSRVKGKEKLPSPSTSTSDLPPVASPQCKLPIQPLSPMKALPEDLTTQSISTN